MATTELGGLGFEGGKPIPGGTLAEIRLGSRAGTARVKLKLPGQIDWTDFGDLTVDPITNEITLPVKLAFLCHAKEDAPTVRQLATRLVQDGVMTWFDEKDLLPGDDWKAKIDGAIEGSDYVLVFLSSVSVSKTGYFPLSDN